ncbi:MAG: peptidylprolyl isomerase [Candidatus Jacksonbacteria bacterium]|jgi:peptidyl-prolyl cis-trans isomerase B (cyclophilin B)|nr:peptidylprolyl isomerase [Candidatus Jacksonbacteria bacterium]MBT6034309.1 peptidylprolyl isomerase [Candidatus Jacksonbacteria bacterium]MBT6301380.1 peptidylprolyl isomerase [Candidatus Jacksonbacteria bacterium]MBT6757069.1 peptidylprolyl isomerase [Candidatus Jacksonbacteria bacterium]MBT6954738.1 peptidylprolyl isomerase [Candidatus Jacksonbacteria bacterium]
MKYVIFSFIILTTASMFTGCTKDSDQQAQNDTDQNVAGEHIEQATQPLMAQFETSEGAIVFELFEEKAPVTVANFVKLAESGFYDGVRFHRVIKDFMIQTGDPNSKDDDWSNDGTGGPGYTFEDEFSPDDSLIKGSLAMANAGPNTNGSQFFVVTAASTPWLNGKHTLFGKVVEGMDIVEAIENVSVNAQDHPLEDVTITGIQILIDTDKL